MKRFLTLALAATIAPTFAACSAGHGSSAALLPAAGAKAPQHHVRHMKSDRQTKDLIGGTLNLALGLLDAPLLGDPNAKLNVAIQGVDAIDANGDSWQLIANGSEQMVNLIELQTNALNLGNGSLPAGTYPTLELLLDNQNMSATIFGQTYPVHIVTPEHPWWDSTQTVQAVDIPLNISGSAGQSISATLDFNVFQSANFVDGVVNLTPTVVGGLGSPSIKGTVLNAAGAPVSSATVVATDSNGHVANVTATAADGTFLLHGINPGGYTVSVQNTYTTAAGATVTASGADAGASPSTYVIVGPSDAANVGTLSD